MEVLTREEKLACVQALKTSDKDTGSSPVQVAILTKKIEILGEHLKRNSKDKHSQKGFLRFIEQRRKHLNYLKKNNFAQYEKTIKELGLRK